MYMTQPVLGGYKSDSASATGSGGKYTSATELAPLASSIDGSEIDLRRWDSPVEEQLRTGSCTANATVGDLEHLRLAAGKSHINLSRLFIYYNARAQHQATSLDEGSYISLAFDTLRTLGTCREETWAFDQDRVNVRPSWDAYREAFTHKIVDYYRIQDSDSEKFRLIDEALRRGHPVVFGCTVDEKFIRDTGSSGVIAPPAKVRVNTGGHAMLIVGKQRSGCYIVKNSWGTDWGDSGYCYMPPAYLSEENAHDFWVATVGWQNAS